MPPSTVSMSRIRAEDVVRYARWLRELMSGRVDVQSRARRSYKAVVMLTEALLAFGMEKLTSRMIAVWCRRGRRRLAAQTSRVDGWDGVKTAVARSRQRVHKQPDSLEQVFDYRGAQKGVSEWLVTGDEVFAMRQGAGSRQEQRRALTLTLTLESSDGRVQNREGGQARRGAAWARTGESGVGRTGLCMSTMKLLGMDGEEKHQWAVGE